MKIGWFTPFLKNSAIGKYSKIATDILSRDHDIDILTFNEQEEGELHDTSLNIYQFKGYKYLDFRISNYDLIVYNMGNSVDWFSNIYETSLRHPGILILHDYIMHHFFLSYFLKKDNLEGYFAAMEKTYGAEAAEIARSSFSSHGLPLWKSSQVAKFPLCELLAPTSHATVVHSKFHAKLLNHSNPFPVETIYFPYIEKSRRSSATKAELGLPEDKIIVASTGCVASHNRIDKIISAIAGKSDLQSKLLYLIIGPPRDKEYYDRLQLKVLRYGLERCVKFLGFLPEDTYYDYLNCVDIFANLRFPATESASWSLVEKLYSGKPVIANNIGFYGEMPDNCLIKINPACEIADVSDSLTKATNDFAWCRQIGLDGQKFARSFFNPDRYIENFNLLLETHSRFTPMRNLKCRVDRELSFLKIDPDSEVVKIVAEKFDTFFREAKS